jgi:hypothetical protein
MGGFRVDAVCLMMSIGSPNRVVMGWEVPGLNSRGTTKTRQRLRSTCTGTWLITTLSGPPAELSLPGIVRSRLRHLASRTGVCTDRRGARVCLRPPLTAG